MPQTLISDFTKKVLENISQIPSGKVATYKQIAELSGKPQASRGVSWILHTCSTKYKLPWHRVLNSQGKISFDKLTHNFRKQKAKLISEGVEVSAAGELSLAKYQWSKKAKNTKSISAHNKPQMFKNKTTK